MKKIFLLPMSLMVLFVVCAMSSKAMATEHEDTATGDASARIVGGITITPDSTVELNFGDIIPDSSASTVKIGTAGGLTVTGGALVSGSYSQGQFEVVGATSATYTITLPSSAIDLKNTSGSGSETMEVTSFVSNPSTSGILDSTTGKQTLSVGATLALVGNQVVGTYEGTYDVTVNYN